MHLGRASIVGWLVARLARLRFPTLFLLTAGLFLLDLLVPDLVPLADELLLGLATALLGSWRKRGGERAPHATSTGVGTAPGHRPGA
jgi:hypothetical protein